MPRKKKNESPELPALEEAMEELAAIVSELESGQQPLDESLKKFERGIQLMKHCDQQLTAAAGRIEQLQNITDDGVDVLPFDGTATVDQPSDDNDTSDSLF